MEVSIRKEKILTQESLDKGNSYRPSGKSLDRKYLGNILKRFGEGGPRDVSLKGNNFLPWLKRPVMLLQL